ncbi:MAG: response regulator [Armatimonadota bacterium]|nr:response regulator [Armatimonadota bacterium]
MMEIVEKEPRLLIVDDEPANVRLLEEMLKDEGYTHIESTTDSRKALDLYTTFRPDLLLVDLMMPHVDGFAVMDQVRYANRRGSFVPILVLTADMTTATKRRALSAGANDFLTKPFDVIEALLRIQNLLTMRFMHLQLRDQNVILEEKVTERTQQLEESQVEILERLAQAAEFRDDDTGQHTRRVGTVSALIATEIGLPDNIVELIRRTAPLHDVGKIGIPDNVLLKPGKLLPLEFERIKQHTTIGASMLAAGRSELVQMARRIALSHHERWDGSGYPHGLSGEDIPIEGRIVAVADVLDALTHVRPYKQAWSYADATVEIQRQMGRQFDPTIVEAFLRLPQETIDALT